MIQRIDPIRAMRHGAVFGLIFGVLQATITWNLYGILGTVLFLIGSAVGGVVVFTIVVKIYNSFIHDK